MPKLLNLLRVLCFLTSMFPAAYAADTSPKLKDGIWVGTLKTPNGQELRIVVEVFEKADGKVAAVMGSPDQGRMGMPFDEFTFSDGTLRCGMSAAGLVIEGEVSEDFSTIDATLTQGGNIQPLPLKAVNELPGPPPRPQTPRRPLPLPGRAGGL